MGKIVKIEKSSFGESSKTGRQEMIGGWQQDIGNEVIKNLALLGFSKVFIVDMDTISISNLSRTVLFTADDLGLYKAEIAAKRFREMSVAPTEKISADYFVGDLINDLGQGVFRRCDIILGCLDNIYTRRNVNMRAAVLQKPYLDAGIGSLYSNLSVVHFPYTACLECGMDNESIQQESIRRTSCDTYKFKAIQEHKVPTTQVASALISALMCQEAVKVLHDDDPEQTILEQSVEKRTRKIKIGSNTKLNSKKKKTRLVPKYGCKYYFDGNDNAFSVFPILRRNDCFCQVDGYLDFAMSDKDIVETEFTNQSTVRELLSFMYEKTGKKHQLVLDVHPLDVESNHAFVKRTQCRGIKKNGQFVPCEEWVNFGGKPRNKIYKDDCFCSKHINDPNKRMDGATTDEIISRFYEGMDDDEYLDFSLNRIGFPKLAIVTVATLDEDAYITYIELTGDLSEVMPNLGGNNG